MSDGLTFDPRWVLNAVANGLIILDADQHVVEWNDWMAQHSGIDSAQATGKALAGVMPETGHSRLSLAIDNALRYRMSSLISPSLHKPIMRLYQHDKDQVHDRRMQQLINITPMTVAGKTGCLLQIQDMTATVRREKRLRMHADQLRATSYMDSLTGIGNRRKFDEAVREEFSRAQRGHTPISMIMIDIDYFKLYNDLYGHQMGDECLARVAGILRDILRHSGDAACRYGGEEFAVILPGTRLDGACAVAERLRLAVDTQMIRHEHSKIVKHITISLGIATLENTEGQDAQSLIHAADMALYHAKTDGRNRSVAFSLDSGSIHTCA